MPDQLPDQKTPSPSIAREKEQAFPSTTERVPIVEAGRIPETPAEREGLVNRVEKEQVELLEPIKDEDGQNLVTSASSSEPKIILPISEQTFTFKDNWHKPVSTAIRWLLVWALRVMKINPGNTGFKNN